uniref:Uncharacterized protein n=1 Tax=Pararge aegeria TaxID=116150 RepID=S4NZ87_9NEOP
MCVVIPLSHQRLYLSYRQSLLSIIASEAALSRRSPKNTSTESIFQMSEYDRPLNNYIDAIPHLYLMLLSSGSPDL